MASKNVAHMTEEERIRKGFTVSVDAQFVAGRIVLHMWIIFVLLPVVLLILFALLK